MNVTNFSRMSLLALAILVNSGCAHANHEDKSAPTSENRVEGQPQKLVIESQYVKAIKAAIDQFESMNLNYSCFNIVVDQKVDESVRVSFLNDPPKPDENGDIVFLTGGGGPCGVGVSFIVSLDGKIEKQILIR